MKIGNKIRFFILTLFYILMITSCNSNIDKVYAVNYYIDNELITSIKLEEGKELEFNKYKIYIEEKNCYLSQYLSTVVGENQTFDCWYSDNTYTNIVESNIVERDYNLYGRIVDNLCTITFETNSETKINPIIIKQGTKLEQLEEPTKEDHTFSGWFIDEHLTIPFEYNKEIYSDLTLYAKWNEVIKYSDFSVHFLQLGNYNAGDCIYIKAGESDILIDGGSRESSLSSITNYVDQYCEDKILEYVIVTHAHQDHIACFAAENGLFDKYEVKTIIDFALSDSTTNVYENYLLAREEEIEAGAVHYDANECVKGLNGAQKTYQITKDISFEILEHKYYYTANSSENNYSVCVMFRHVDSYFLFTGDLEEAGEKSLVQLNDLPEVELYKAGHHGSKTSSTDELLEVIKPKVVAVCCCAGTDEYSRLTDNQFPSQDFINRVAKYTDKIYLPLVATYTVATATSNWGGVSKGKEYLKRTGFKPLNGDIVVTSVAGVVSVKCSNSDIILKDSEWFNATITLNGQTRKMRTWPSDGV